MKLTCSSSRTRDIYIARGYFGTISMKPKNKQKRTKVHLPKVFCLDALVHRTADARHVGGLGDVIPIHAPVPRAPDLPGTCQLRVPGTCQLHVRYVMSSPYMPPYRVLQTCRGHASYVLAMSDTGHAPQAPAVTTTSTETTATHMAATPLHPTLPCPTLPYPTLPYPTLPSTLLYPTRPYPRGGVWR